MSGRRLRPEALQVFGVSQSRFATKPLKLLVDIDEGFGRQHLAQLWFAQQQPQLLLVQTQGLRPSLCQGASLL